MARKTVRASIADSMPRLGTGSESRPDAPVKRAGTSQTEAEGDRNGHPKHIKFTRSRAVSAYRASHLRPRCRRRLYFGGAYLSRLGDSVS